MQTILEFITRPRFLREWRQQRIVKLVRRGACVLVLSVCTSGIQAQEAACDPASGCESTACETGSCGEPDGFFGRLKCWSKEKQYEMYLRYHHKHPRFHYPVVSPFCSPTYGYHETCWRKLPPSNAHCPCPSPMIEYAPSSPPPVYMTPDPEQIEAMPMPVEPAPEYSPMPDAQPEVIPRAVPENGPIAPPMPVEPPVEAAPMKKAEAAPQWQPTRQAVSSPAFASPPFSAPPVQIEPQPQPEFLPATLQEADDVSAEPIQAPLPPTVRRMPQQRVESSASFARLAPRTALEPVACHPIVLVDFDISASSDRLDPRMLLSSKGPMPRSPKTTRPLLRPQPGRVSIPDSDEIVTTSAAVVQLASDE